MFASIAHLGHPYFWTNNADISVLQVLLHTLHLHIVFVPVIHKLDTKSGKVVNKIACSEYWKGKDSYRILQDNFYKYVIQNGFDLERGKSKNIEHLSTEKLKQITDYENIKYEINNEQIKQLETKQTSLIVTQNTELINYTNKLKQHLVKSYKAIEKVEELKKENILLKRENENLKQENYRLRNYIDKTFEVVKHLFNFPMRTFKNLVDNFVKTFEK